jgi:hypothetical protein
MVGGDLHWIWKPYEFYANVDHVRGFLSFLNPWALLTLFVRCMAPKLSKTEKGSPELQARIFLLNKHGGC